MSFLDKEGLRYFWQGAKKKFYNKSEIDSQREELQKGIDDASKTGGVEVGAVVGWTGERVPEGYDEVKRGFSTEEILTGETWTNGKPIYRKIVNFGALPNTNIKNFAVGISNVDFLLPPRGVANNGSEDITIPNTYASASFTYIDGLTVQHANNTISTVSIRTNSDRSKFSAYVILEYTKTTDTGNFKYIEKKSVTELEAITGSIVDTFNVNDKTTNAPSVNAVENYVGDNLAEVLMPKDTIYSTDLNEIVNTGCYVMTTNVTNEPPTVTGWGGFLIVFRPYISIADVCCQLFVDASGGNIYIRTNWFGTWYNWKSLL